MYKQVFIARPNTSLGSQWDQKPQIPGNVAQPRRSRRSEYAYRPLADLVGCRLQRPRRCPHELHWCVRPWSSLDPHRTARCIPARIILEGPGYELSPMKPRHSAKLYNSSDFSTHKLYWLEVGGMRGWGGCCLRLSRFLKKFADRDRRCLTKKFLTSG